jgi:hypothetical protein
MTKPTWWKPEVTPGNVVSWMMIAVGGVSVFTVLLADVRTLQAARDDMRTRLEKIEVRAEQDRMALAEIKGDIRVIRQILEGAPRRP